MTVITGPLGSTVLKLVLDTGATTRAIKLANLLSLGFDPNQSARHVPMTTVIAADLGSRGYANAVECAGQHRFGFPVLVHVLPAASAVDGLLGLDFFEARC